MLTRIYVEALLVDEELAAQVWEAWDAGVIDDSAAIRLWAYICITCRNLAIYGLSR